MNLPKLNKRIATEFMGWTFVSEDKNNYAMYLTQDYQPFYTCYEHSSVERREGFFAPTTDMNAAMLVLEKIASKMDVKLTKIKLKNSNDWKWECLVEYHFVACIELMTDDDSLPLAISLLAEAIMDSPEHMELFK